MAKPSFASTTLLPGPFPDSRVDGHSMEPMLHPGDIVVIDRDDKIIVKNKMFAIYHEGGLTAKFLEQKTRNPSLAKLLKPRKIYNVHHLIQNSASR